MSKINVIFVVFILFFYASERLHAEPNPAGKVITDFIKNLGGLDWNRADIPTEIEKLQKFIKDNHLTKSEDMADFQNSISRLSKIIKDGVGVEYENDEFIQQWNAVTVEAFKKIVAYQSHDKKQIHNLKQNIDTLLQKIGVVSNEMDNKNNIRLQIILKNKDIQSDLINIAIQAQKIIAKQVIPPTIGQSTRELEKNIIIIKGLLAKNPKLESELDRAKFIGMAGDVTGWAWLLSDSGSAKEFFKWHLTRLKDGLTSGMSAEAKTSLRSALVKDGGGPTGTTEEKALQDFQNALRKITDELKIHIVRAWYGNLETKWSEGYLCDAWNALEGKCQRQTNCAAPETAANAEVNAIALCGFNPAGTARGRARGLRVRYSCFRGSDLFWAKLKRQPTIHPKTEKPFSNLNSVLTTLRSGSMQLRCPYPISSAEAQAAAEKKAAAAKKAAEEQAAAAAERQAATQAKPDNPTSPPVEAKPAASGGPKLQTMNEPEVKATGEPATSGETKTAPEAKGPSSEEDTPAVVSKTDGKVNGSEGAKTEDDRTATDEESQKSNEPGKDTESTK